MNLRKRLYWRFMVVHQDHPYSFSPTVCIKLICKRFRINPNSGSITERFEFKMDNDTQVFRSCSATLNGELFVFGGYDSGKNQGKQVIILS